MSEQTQTTTRKKTAKKAEKKGRAAKAKAPEKGAEKEQKQEKQDKQQKQQRQEKQDKEAQADLVVFAHRMTLQEREAFHKAAGPARASNVARQLAVAFTNEDDAAFRALIKEAREVRG